MLIVLVSLLVIVVKAVQQVFTVLEKIESEGGAINMSTISNAVTQATTTSDSFIFNFVLLLIIFCWIIGVVDAYRIGKRRDIEGQSMSQVSNSKGN